MSLDSRMQAHANAVQEEASEPEPIRQLPRRDPETPIIQAREWDRTEVIAELTGLKAAIQLALYPYSGRARTAFDETRRDALYQRSDVGIISAAIEMLTDDDPKRADRER